MNKDVWKNILVAPDSSIISAIEIIGRGASGIALVVDGNQRLLGTITDGDVRRHLLRQGKLDAPVTYIMNQQSITGSLFETKEQLLSKMQNRRVLHLPIVDAENKVVGLETLSHLTQKEKHANWVIFMAGGFGTRLHPLTLDYPKPLVKIGAKPILEILLENFISQGFVHFYFSVNYKADMIQQYFGSGERWGVDIQYIHEDQALGTVGSLSLLPSIPQLPFFVVNADIMTNLNFEQILEFHMQNPSQPIATICVRQHQNTIPYGVVQIDPDRHNLLGIHEKPTQSYFVNAGIYMLNPAVLNHLPKENTFCDMPSLLLELVKNNQFVATFPIREYWLDIGSHANLSQAISDYEQVFV